MGLSTDIWGSNFDGKGNMGWELLSCDRWVVYEGAVSRPMISDICFRL